MSPLERLKWLKQITADNRLSSMTAKTAIVLANHCNNTTGKCYPSYKTISKHATCTKPTVIKAVTELEKFDYIKVERFEKSKGIRKNYYTLLGNNIDYPSKPTLTIAGKPVLPKQDNRKQGIINKNEDVQKIINSYKLIRREGANTKQTETNIKKRLKKHTAEELLTTVTNYRKVVENESRETIYRMKAANFFGQKAGYEEYLTVNFDSSQTSNTSELDDEDDFTYSEEQIAEIMKLEETIAKEADMDMET